VHKFSVLLSIKARYYCVRHDFSYSSYTLKAEVTYQAVGKVLYVRHHFGQVDYRA